MILILNIIGIGEAIPSLFSADEITEGILVTSRLGLNDVVDIIAYELIEIANSANKMMIIGAV